MWQAEGDTELTLSASPTTAVGQKALALAKRRYSTVYQFLANVNHWWKALDVVFKGNFLKEEIELF